MTLLVPVQHGQAQRLDLNGDGQRETFSATMRIYDDGSADSQLLIGDGLRVDLVAGSVSCVDGVAVAEANGILYRVENGDLTEIGTVNTSARTPDGQGAETLPIFSSTSSTPLLTRQTIRMVVVATL